MLQELTAPYDYLTTIRFTGSNANDTMQLIWEHGANFSSTAHFRTAAMAVNAVINNKLASGKAATLGSFAGVDIKYLVTSRTNACNTMTNELDCQQTYQQLSGI